MELGYSRVFVWQVFIGSTRRMELPSTEIKKNTGGKKGAGGDQELGLECIKLELSISSPSG